MLLPVSRESTSNTHYVCMSYEAHGGTQRVRAYQFPTVGLVYAVLHRFVDEFGVGRVCGEGGGEDSETL